MIIHRAGKSLLFFFTFILISNAYSQIKLDVKNMAGQALDQAGVGQPFLLEVIIEGGAGNNFSTPEIKSPFVPLKRTGFQMITVNGVSRVVYTFTARIDKPGTYQFGPATVQSGNTTLESEPLEIVVCDQPITQQKQRSSNTKQIEPALARLLVSGHKAVVGEKIYVALRFYRLDPSVEFHAITEPEQDKNQGFIIKNRQEAQQGQEEIDGVLHDYIQWQWEIYPNKVGEIVIPAYSIDYSLRPDVYDFFSTLFGTRIAKKIYSNAVTIKVDPLPPYQGKVDGIGHCKNIKASLKPAVMHEGEGAVLTIMLDGDIDIEQFPLQNLPSNIKAYESKKYMKDNKHYFEYVIQAKKHGEIEIPGQPFTYFDVGTYQYNTLHTNVVPINILKSDAAETPCDEPSISEEKKNKQDSNEIEPIIRYMSSQTKERFIPWHLFIIFVLIPLLLFIFNIAKNKITFIDQIIPPLRRWRLIRAANMKLSKAMAEQNCAQLYPIFLSLFAELLKKDPATITGSDIEDWFMKHTSKEIQVKWQHFFIALNQARFLTHETTDTILLFDEAKQWISFLSKRRF